MERKKSLTWAAKVGWILYIFGGQIRSSEAAMCGEGGRAAPLFGGGDKLKKTGARSARARTQGQDPLVRLYFYHENAGTP